MSVAEVIDLADWAAIKEAKPGNAMPFDWGSLSMPSDCRDFAHRYVRLGLHPILLYGVRDDGACMCGGRHEKAENSIGKHPVGAEWQTRPVDLPGIERALVRDWRHNIGLRMGTQPCGWRLVAIDVDGPRSLLEPLEAKWGALPETLTATSGKGMHLVYRLRDGAAMPKNATKIAPGVDIRSEGGQIVVAPSRHRLGSQYRWLNAREPAVLP